MSLKADRLYAANAEYIANVVWKRLHGYRALPMADKEDYAQVAFRKVYDALERHDGDKATLHTYIYIVAINAIRDCMRKSNRIASRIEDGTDIDLVSSAPLGVADSIDAVVDAMPDTLREAIDAVLDMGRPKAAHALGLTRTELADRLNKAREWLMLSLQEREKTSRGQ